MRHLLCTIFIITAAVVTAKAEPLECDTVDEAALMHLAYQHRYGVMKEVNPKKSAAIYARLAKRGNVKAMNQLGMMYLNGDGVEQDYNKARRLFGNAAKGGDNHAKCNLALMYQKGMGVPLDYGKSFALYMSAAEAGSAKGLYGAGYHLYKGLGVNQNYAKAISLLEKGSAKGHSGCDLLLASYYANGYGGDADAERAEQHYRHASRRGNSWTVDVTKLGVVDSIQKRREHRGKWKHVRNKTIPAKGMRHVNGSAKADSIAGRWTGTAYTYDWSRTEILSEEDITLDMKADGDSIMVSWYKGDSLCTDGTLAKHDDKYILTHASTEQRERPWLLTAAKFDCNANELYAALRTFCLDTKEKRLPVFAVLEREKSATSGNHQQTFTIESASAANGIVTVCVDAVTDMEVKAELCSVTGMPVRQLGTKDLTVGHNKIEFVTLSLKKGVYAVRLTHKGERHSKTITVLEP